jgi:hypothetical protein
MIRKSGNRFSRGDKREAFAGDHDPEDDAYANRACFENAVPHNGEETGACNRRPGGSAIILLFWLTIRRQYA